MSADSTTRSTPTVEEQLDALQRESEERRAELREIAAQLPAALSRRAILRQMVGDLRNAPDKADVIVRALRKLRRVLQQAARALKRRLVQSAR